MVDIDAGAEVIELDALRRIARDRDAADFHSQQLLEVIRRLGGELDAVRRYIAVLETWPELDVPRADVIAALRSAIGE
jgi:hypothetical protein